MLGLDGSGLKIELRWDRGGWIALPTRGYKWFTSQDLWKSRWFHPMWVSETAAECLKYQFFTADRKKIFLVEKIRIIGIKFTKILQSRVLNERESPQLEHSSAKSCPLSVWLRLCHLKGKIMLGLDGSGLKIELRPSITEQEFLLFYPKPTRTKKPDNCLFHRDYCQKT